MNNEIPLLPLVRRSFENDPIAAAHCLETMDENDAVEVIKTLPLSVAAQAIHQLNDSYSAVLLQKLPRNLFKKIINNLDPKQGANIFLKFSNDMRQVFLDLLEEKIKKQIQELLTYPEDSAGRIMTTDLIAFHGDIKVREAVQKIRQLARKGGAESYIYVIDKDEHLIGVLNMRDMLLASENDILETVMLKDVFTVHCFTDREKVAMELSTRNYFAVPVVDTENRLLGVVRAEHLIDDVQQEATEDIQRMFGVGGDERAFSLDPAQCSSIILTTITDVMGFFAFLGFAVLFQDYLL